MEQPDDAARRRLALGALWLALAAALTTAAWSALGAPGMFYDEGWLAHQARRFVDPGRAGLLPPGAIDTWFLGRPFPLFALPYLGSLKSQLLIPAIFLFGNELAVTRMTTVVIVAASLLPTMLWAQRAFGHHSAVLGALLIACDPSVFFSAQLEWGPFSTGLLCRALGFWLVTAGWQDGRRVPLALGGLALGLGVYNRADLAIVLGAAGLGLLAAQPALVREALARRRADLAAIAFPLVVGAMPILAAARLVLEAVFVLRSRGDLTERLQVLLATVDGSYFHRLMDVGGRFDGVFSVDAPAGLLAVGVLASVLTVVVSAARGGPLARQPGLRFLGVATAVTAFAMLALPGATRSHHMLNLCPFAHLLVARWLVELPGCLPGGRRRATAVALALLALLLLADLRVIGRTRALIEATGGRGFWTTSIDTLARELDAEPGSVAVSMDWGFHLPLLFLTDEPVLIEPIWRIADAIRAAGFWEAEGNAQVRYLVHEPAYDRFEIGPRLLRAARALELRDAARVEIHRHLDREGATAFVSIRLLGPHRVLLDRSGEFRIVFRSEHSRG